MHKFKIVVMLDAGYWIPDTGYRMLDTGYRIPDAGCWMLAGTPSLERPEALEPYL